MLFEKSIYWAKSEGKGEISLFVLSPVGIGWSMIVTLRPRCHAGLSWSHNQPEDKLARDSQLIYIPKNVIVVL